MARVTVEDCILKVSNRFELVLMASQRARVISAGGTLTLERDNDKNPVVALREIAEETLELTELQDGLVRSYQKTVLQDDNDNDTLEMIEAEESSYESMIEGLRSEIAANEDDDSDDMLGDDEDGIDDLEMDIEADMVELN